MCRKLLQSHRPGAEFRLLTGSISKASPPPSFSLILISFERNTKRLICFSIFLSSSALSRLLNPR